MTVLFAGKDSDEEILPDCWHVPEYGRCIGDRLGAEKKYSRSYFSSGFQFCKLGKSPKNSNGSVLRALGHSSYY
jgi:hypothetical protein